jgi:uncharacterized membrane protein
MLASWVVASLLAMIIQYKYTGVSHVVVVAVACLLSEEGFMTSCCAKCFPSVSLLACIILAILLVAMHILFLS